MKTIIDNEHKRMLINLVYQFMADTGNSIACIARESNISPTLLSNLLRNLMNISPKKTLGLLKCIGRLDTTENLVTLEFIHQKLEEMSAELNVDGILVKPHATRGRRWSFLSVEDREKVLSLVQKAMRNTGIATSDLCKCTGLAPSYVYDFINGKRGLSEQAITLIVQTLDIDMAQLFHSIGKIPQPWQSLITFDELRELESRYLNSFIA